MNQSHTLAALITAATLSFAAPTLAQTPVETAIEQLEAQGFEIRVVRRTLLGRTRIVAESPEGRREIVLNPRNGLVLRDYFERDRSDAEDVEDISTGGTEQSANRGPDDGGDDNGGSESGGGDDNGGGGEGDDGDNGGDDNGGGDDGGGDDGGDGDDNDDG